MNNQRFFSFRFSLIILFVFTTLFSCKPELSSETAGNANSDSVRTAGLLSERIFFLLYEIEHSPSVREAILKDNTLSQICKEKTDAISTAVKDCSDMDCLVKMLVISDEENQKIISALSIFYHKGAGMEGFMRNKIRPSHAYAFYENYSDSTLFIEAWKEQVKGFNYIFQAYMQNKGFHYAKIDSSLLKVNSQEFLQTVKRLVSESVKNKTSELFFKPLEDISIKLLQINDRDEAVRFLPLSNVNKGAYSRISGTNWDDYPYSGILVLGEGPEDPGLAISEGSKMRAKMGAALYRDKKALFMVVSGGYVHPIHTEYCEAEEMKRFMVDSLGIPEDVIIMEPHARHTTTNLRNTNRIFLGKGIPRAKPILTVTAKSHIDYIVSNRFPRAFIRDIGFVTYAGLKRLSDTTASYYPTMSSFQINSVEPLDP